MWQPRSRSQMPLADINNNNNNSAAQTRRRPSCASRREGHFLLGQVAHEKFVLYAGPLQRVHSPCLRHCSQQGQSQDAGLDTVQLLLQHSPNKNGDAAWGDSDLLLAGLALDPHVCYNVFCVLPDKKQWSTMVSMWETTQALCKHASLLLCCNHNCLLSDVVRLWIDIVLLLLLNSNNYLPKLAFGKMRTPMEEKNNG